MLAVPSSAVTIRRGVEVGGSSLTSSACRGTGSRVPSVPASATETRITPPPWAPARGCATASPTSISTPATHRVLSLPLGSCRPVEAASGAVCNCVARDFNATTDNLRDVGRLFSSASRRS